MFVFGEVSEPLEETTRFVEEIVRSQIIEVLIQGVAQAYRKGSKYLNPEDLMFLIRHDRPKQSRLRSFLAWKDARKNAKGDKDGDAAGGPGGGGGGADARARKNTIKLSWEFLPFYSSVLDDADDDGGDDDGEDDDEEDRIAYEAQLARLRAADEMTRTMTREEYMYFSDCRQASFTYKKVKRFREWCAMAHYYDNKANSDVLDILGFLAHEVVSRITETALQVKREQERRAVKDEDALGDLGLFGKATNEQAPLTPAHIAEAYRRLQRGAVTTMRFRSHRVRTAISLI
ncbi:hypothetical protein CXG81DRAFT_10641 [Caulochytrium protostelioides]|uniref:Uncharacterized protein n=1 Tax=Caulochytrium protostelioides TaxID=1555241 RepID=A0A4P9XB17_9FUNG|nr:hypothetical protein CXG81DRAFT_10641 [Caulochytrium protostelioides]|eukprot:RKP02584.1 hypothetical protein CXG81DRAFT_10641 [Caulochytrium protostelioides]